VEFDYDGGGLAKGATITLFIDGDRVGTGHLDATVPMVFSADETTDVGHDTGTGVSDEYRTGDNNFTGTVHWVQIDIDDKAEDFDHLITPEERWQIAMARQ
jgi:arylsulfatase